MIPTKRGASLLAISATLYGLAWVTSIGWFYVADAVFWALLLVNVVYPTLIMRGLSAQRRLISLTGGRPADIYEDDMAHIAIDLRNRSVVPKSLFTLHEDCPLAAPGEERLGFFVGMVGPRGLLTASYDVRCYRRGAYSFGPIRVETSAPFGLFRAGRHVAATLEATVYPRVFPMETSSNQGPLHGDLPHTSAPGQTGEFRSTREYRNTDSPRHIHWRNSARQARLMVREFDQVPQGEVRVAFNPEVDLGEGRDTTLEYGIKIAAALARRSFRDRRPFRMWPGGHDGAMATWHGVLEHLARLRPGPDPAIEKLLGQGKLPGASVVIVCAADRRTLRLLSQHRSAARRSVVVLLRGFGVGEDDRAQESLTRTGARVVVCRPGRLLDAIEQLDRDMATAVSGSAYPSSKAVLTPSRHANPQGIQR